MIISTQVISTNIHLTILVDNIHLTHITNMLFHIYLYILIKPLFSPTGINVKYLVPLLYSVYPFNTI